MPAEVIGFDGNDARIMPFGAIEGLEPGSMVVALNRQLHVPVGWSLTGRILNGLGAPIDGKGPIRLAGWRSLKRDTPSALDRPVIDKPFVTGQRVIDGLLTLGQGQRVGLFAGSGVGKSTLLGEIARGAEADVNVVVLVGERGREVRPFLDRCLGSEGLSKSVVIISTSDEPPLTRLRALQTAVTIADYFRSTGSNVLFLLDSLTRLAHAQREVGLLLGEPPSARGYTPSVFQLMSTTLETLGRTPEGSITAIITILVDGDDTEEPIADAARSILDGHIVLDRQLAQKQHFPAVNIGASISRLFPDVTSSEHQSAATSIREILATHDEVVDLIRVGAYQQGMSPLVDKAIRLRPAVETILKQQTGTFSPITKTVEAMRQVSSIWQS